MLSVATFFIKKFAPPIVGDLALAISLIVLTAAFGPRSLWVILGSVVVFAFLLKPFGLVIATLGLTFISAWGGTEFKQKEIWWLFVVLVIFARDARLPSALGLPYLRGSR